MASELQQGLESFYGTRFLALVITVLQLAEVANFVTVNFQLKNKYDA
jgi:hypothetical protein